MSRPEVCDTTVADNTLNNVANTLISKVGRGRESGKPTWNSYAIRRELLANLVKWGVIGRFCRLADRMSPEKLATAVANLDGCAQGRQGKRRTAPMFVQASHSHQGSQRQVPVATATASSTIAQQSARH